MKALLTTAGLIMTSFSFAQNVGINTSTPGSPLTIKTNGIGLSQESPDGNTRIGFYTQDGSAWLQTHSKSNLNFTTFNGTTRMVLDTLHNVGIGDFDLTAPAARLHIRGNTAMNNSVYVTNPNASNGSGVALGVSGVYSELTSTTGGNFSAALRGINRGTNGAGIGVAGYHAGSGWALYGETPGGTAVQGLTTTGTAGLFRATGSGNALYTSGRIYFTGNNEAAGRVLTSDVGGAATWQQPVSPSANTGFKVTYGGPTTVGHASIATVPFTYIGSVSGAFNDAGNFDNASNSYTAPTSGFYSFDVTVAFSNRTATQAGEISVQGIATGFIGANIPSQSVRFNSGDVVPGSMNLTFKTKLDAGDKISVRVYHSIGGNLTISGPCQFTGVRLF